MLRPITPNDYKEFCVVLNPEKIFIGENVRIDSHVKLEGGQGLYIYDDVHIASFCHINTGGGKLIIHKGVGIGSHTGIATGQPDLSSYHITPNDPESLPPLRDETIIYPHVLIGMHCAILKGVTIDFGAVIGAMTLVNKDVHSNVQYTSKGIKELGERIL